MFSIKNAVYVALMQICVIVFGVLIAGLWLKLLHDGDAPLQLSTMVLATNGFFFFAIPMVWIVFASLINTRREASDDVKNLTLFFGVLILIALGVFVLVADVGPIFNGDMWVSPGAGDK